MQRKSDFVEERTAQQAERGRGKAPSFFPLLTLSHTQKFKPARAGVRAHLSWARLLCPIPMASALPRTVAEVRSARSKKRKGKAFGAPFLIAPAHSHSPFFTSSLLPAGRPRRARRRLLARGPCGGLHCPAGGDGPAQRLCGARAENQRLVVSRRGPLPAPALRPAPRRSAHQRQGQPLHRGRADDGGVPHAGQ